MLYYCYYVFHWECFLRRGSLCCNGDLSSVRPDLIFRKTSLSVVYHQSCSFIFPFLIIWNTSYTVYLLFECVHLYVLCLMQFNISSGANFICGHPLSFVVKKISPISLVSVTCSLVSIFPGVACTDSLTVVLLFCRAISAASLFGLESSGMIIVGS